MTKRTRILRKRSGQRGAVMVEGVVAIPFFLLMFAGIVFVGKLYETKMRVMRMTTKPSDVQQPRGRKRQRHTDAGGDGADLQFGQDRADRKHGGREEQAKGEAARRRERDDDEVAPVQSERQVQPEGDAQADRRQDADRLADGRGCEQCPGAGAIAAQQHTRIHEAEQEQHGLHGVLGQMLEEAHRNMTAIRRLRPRLETARNMRQERHDRHERECRMEAVEVQRPP